MKLKSKDQEVDLDRDQARRLGVVRSALELDPEATEIVLPAMDLKVVAQYLSKNKSYTPKMEHCPLDPGWMLQSWQVDVVEGLDLDGAVAAALACEWLDFEELCLVLVLVIEFRLRAGFNRPWRRKGPRKLENPCPPVMIDAKRIDALGLPERLCKLVIDCSWSVDMLTRWTLPASPEAVRDLWARLEAGIDTVSRLKSDLTFALTHHMGMLPDDTVLKWVDNLDMLKPDKLFRDRRAFGVELARRGSKNVILALRHHLPEQWIICFVRSRAPKDAGLLIDLVEALGYDCCDCKWSQQYCQDRALITAICTAASYLVQSEFWMALDAEMTSRHPEVWPSCFDKCPHSEFPRSVLYKFPEVMDWALKNQVVMIPSGVRMRVAMHNNDGLTKRLRSMVLNGKSAKPKDPPRILLYHEARQEGDLLDIAIRFKNTGAVQTILMETTPVCSESELEEALEMAKDQVRIVELVKAAYPPRPKEETLEELLELHTIRNVEYNPEWAWMIEKRPELLLELKLSSRGLSNLLRSVVTTKTSVPVLKVLWGMDLTSTLALTPKHDAIDLFLR